MQSYTTRIAVVIPLLSAVLGPRGVLLVFEKIGQILLAHAALREPSATGPLISLSDFGRFARSSSCRAAYVATSTPAAAAFARSFDSASEEIVTLSTMSPF